MADIPRRPDDPQTFSGGDTSPEDVKLLDEVNQVSEFLELGATGLKRAAGYVDEEFLPQLRGRKAVAVYKEMSENDPIVGALLFAIERLLRNVEWRVEPAGKSKEHADAAKLVETAMDDMNVPWSEFIAEVLTCIPFGWSWHEVVYKRRGGPWARDPRHRSKHTDGLIGWRKMPIRAQETLLRWTFDESGDVSGMVQLAPPHYRTVVMPIERSLLFRPGQHKGNPEGRSFLRNAYRPWFYKKRLEEIEAVGIERDLAGMPKVGVPAEMLKAKAGSEQAKQVEAFKKMVKSIRRNEQEGFVFPIAYDQDTKQPLYTFDLVGGGGARAFNVDATIRRYEERMLGTVLADFILVGHQGTGSYSMHTDKTGIFRNGVNSVNDMIAEVFNRFAIPRLFAANGWKPAELPTLVPSDVDAPDLAQLAQFMTSMGSLGVSWFPDPTMENFVRQAARLPELDKDEQERQRQLQMRTEATRFAQANSEYLQARMAMMQGATPGATPQTAAGDMGGSAPAAGSSAPGSTGATQPGPVQPQASPTPAGAQ